MKDSVYRLRLPYSTRQEWDAAAAELGVPVAQLVRDAVAAYVGPKALIVGAPVVVAEYAPITQEDIRAAEPMPSVRKKSTRPSGRPSLVGAFRLPKEDENDAG
jgi:hypothetical protein